MHQQPMVIGYRMGVDSTAMLIGLHQRGIRPDLILFADTGGEKPDTYLYAPINGCGHRCCQQRSRTLSSPATLTSTLY